MFSLLSHQEKLLEQLEGYSDQEREYAVTNMQFVIDSLCVESSQLVLKKRNHGIIIPVNNANSAPVELEKAQTTSLQQLLIAKVSLVNAINALCLSEAIAVRNNFSNCMEELIERGIAPPSTIIEKRLSNHSAIGSGKISDEVTNKSVERNNVSPIRLTQIKQRLAKAVQENSNKKEEVKDKLNSLLSLSKGANNKINKRA